MWAYVVCEVGAKVAAELVDVGAPVFAAIASVEEQDPDGALCSVGVGEHNGCAGPVEAELEGRVVSARVEQQPFAVFGFAVCVPARHADVFGSERELVEFAVSVTDGGVGVRAAVVVADVAELAGGVEVVPIACKPVVAGMAACFMDSAFRSEMLDVKGKGAADVEFAVRAFAMEQRRERAAYVVVSPHGVGRCFVVAVTGCGSQCRGELWSTRS